MCDGQLGDNTQARDFLLFWSRGAWNVWSRGGARPCGDFATKEVTKNNIKSFSRTVTTHTHTHTHNYELYARRRRDPRAAFNRAGAGYFCLHTSWLIEGDPEADRAVEE
jgi:hypothetical protein